MQIARSGRFVFVAQWFAAVLLPAFVFVGRGFVGAELGWVSVLAFSFGVFLIFFLLLPPAIALLDAQSRKARRSRGAYCIASYVLWAALVVAGLSLPDAGDGVELDSALSAWTGGALSYEASISIFSGALLAVLISYVAVFGLAISGITMSRRAAILGS